MRTSIYLFSTLIFIRLSAVESGSIAAVVKITSIGYELSGHVFEHGARGF